MQTSRQLRLLGYLMLYRRTLSFSLHQKRWFGYVPKGIGSCCSRHALPSNQELVEKRLAVNRRRKAAHTRSVDEVNNRNYRLKRLLHTNASAVPEMYAAKVSVCGELRDELKLNGREKRGRIFIEKTSNATKSLKCLKHELHQFFRALKRSTFILSGGYPIIEEDGSVTSPTVNSTSSFWDILSDKEVLKTFEAADAMYLSKSDVLKRPSFALHVRRDPNAPLPPPPPAYLKDLPDATKTESMTMLSFYSFPPKGVSDPEEFAILLRKLWKPFSCLGRVYVAREGVNAQMSVPTNVIDQFCECCKTIPELAEHMENGINIDPIPIKMSEFAVAGTPVNGRPAPPFRNLHIRVRNQIVADGLDKELNWQSAGYDMPALEWHERLREARRLREEGQDADSPIILDCRNKYETNVGIFEGADPLETESFRDSWDALKDKLSDAPKDTPIMTYCTGGIRCVKVSAYLTQELGFKNVSRLAGGIIAYDRQLNEEETKTDESMFKGTNFVFDGRLGRAITDDTLGSCVTCGCETSLVSNCFNENCHVRIIQCETCKTTYHGTCSEACRNRVANGAMRPKRPRKNPNAADDLAEDPIQSLDDYSAHHSTNVPPFYQEIEFNTKAFLPSGTHMVSGASQGRLLSQFASMSREGRVLELGTFTGYATACLLEGAANVADLLGVSNGNREEGPFVMTMERDSRAFDVAVAQLRTLSNDSNDCASDLAKLRLNDTIDTVKEKSVSLQYGNNKVGCELLCVTDALATVEEMARGKGDTQCAPFDIVFVDADKTRLLEYAEACLSSDRLLKRGGLIIVDNVLWKGLVVQAATGDFTSLIDDQVASDRELRKNRRARKLATKMHYFNSQIVKDDRCEILILPLRDGLSIIRKK